MFLYLAITVYESSFEYFFYNFELSHYGGENRILLIQLENVDFMVDANQGCAHDSNPGSANPQLDWDTKEVYTNLHDNNTTVIIIIL